MGTLSLILVQDVPENVCSRVHISSYMHTFTPCSKACHSASSSCICPQLSLVSADISSHSVQPTVMDVTGSYQPEIKYY